MINCKYVGCNEPLAFDTIINEKYNPGKTVLLGIYDRIMNVYPEYLVNFGTIERKKRSEFAHTEVPEKNALQLCYSSPTTTFVKLSGKIFSIQPDQLITFCPYCLLDRPQTLDHYIGQKEFPEYSILFRNLIPCCYSCNQLKGEIWRKNKKRRFIHFYNDNFLHHPFLNAEFIYKRGQTIPLVRFFLNRPNAMSVNDFRIVKTHFKDLNLLNAYSTRANSLISTEFSVLRNAVQQGQARTQLTVNLLHRSQTEEMKSGVNYWIAVIYKTMANTNRFVNSW